MNSYNLPSIKACNFLLLSFKTVVTRKIWEIYQVKDLALVLGNSRQMRFLNILNSMVFVTIENSASPPPTQILNSSEFTQTLAQRNATQRNATHVSYCNSRKVLATQEELSQACESHLT